MTLLSAIPSRRERHDHLLGASTALVAGLVNVCSVMAFFAFATNVTGHVAVFVEELVKGHHHQVTVVAIWLVSFLLGAGVSSFLAYEGKIRSGATLWTIFPLGLEMLVLAGIGYYGSASYAETLRETESMVGVLLFAMGLQNGLVATVTGGVVKTTHLTGLLTDLGIELALLMRPSERGSPALGFKLRLHAFILGFYMFGGILGGVAFLSLGFGAFFLASFILFLLIAHDLPGSIPTSVRRSVQRFPGVTLARGSQGEG